MPIAERLKKYALVATVLSVAGLGAWKTDLLPSLKTALGSTKPVGVVRPAPSGRGIVAEGRVVPYPGAWVTVGSEIGGKLRRVVVTEKTIVKKGDLLVEIDADEQRAALHEAEARAAEAKVDVGYFGHELDRTRSLSVSGALPVAALDKADHERDAANARREALLATSNRLRTVVAKSRVVAPIDGVVLERFAEEGETVAAGARLVTVADLRRTRIEAEIDEYDAARISLGQEVRVAAEGTPGVVWKGVVEEIPDQVVSRRLKPQDPGRPSDTRVLLVKVALRETAPIVLGQRIEVEILAAEKTK
jgi:RND family efflux transporter MFP subunit